MLPPPALISSGHLVRKIWSGGGSNGNSWDLKYAPKLCRNYAPGRANVANERRLIKWGVSKPACGFHFVYNFLGFDGWQNCELASMNKTLKWKREIIEYGRARRARVKRSITLWIWLSAGQHLAAATVVSLHSGAGQHDTLHHHGKLTKQGRNNAIVRAFFFANSCARSDRSRLFVSEKRIWRVCIPNAAWLTRFRLVYAVFPWLVTWRWILFFTIDSLFLYAYRFYQLFER